jgi:uroporphyrinogen decarboxylase
LSVRGFDLLRFEHYTLACVKLKYSDLICDWAYQWRRIVLTKLSFSTTIEPNIEELLAVLRRERAPKRVHHIELFLDPEMIEAVDLRFELSRNLNRSDPFYLLERDIRVHTFLGYDAFHLGFVPPDLFTMPALESGDTTAGDQSRGRREWVVEHESAIRSWADFEKYPWPRVDEIDLSALEWMEKNLPENMGCYELTANIFEMVNFLQGYEQLCYNLFDAPDLVAGICEKIGQYYVKFTELICDFDCISIVWGSDDLGFRSGTMTSPDFLREQILPWHRECARIAHEHGRPYLLHSCGNLDSVMDDLIDAVGIDAKHSFEDTILPVTEAYKRYGKRISILGGVDVDFLCRAAEPDIRTRVREILDACTGSDRGSGYCLGTGNTVANYIPVDNYLVMLDEGREYRF